ncbi:hypothetical protein HNR33_002694 [Brassicibacter mesophilus]
MLFLKLIIQQKQFRKRGLIFSQNYQDKDINLIKKGQSSKGI